MAWILIADDDESYGRGLEEFLAALGHQTYRVLDAQELAVAVTKRKFDLVVMDMQMPGGGAPSALRALADTPDSAKIPILAVSGMPEAQMRPWFPKRPNIRFFQKPVRMLMIKEAVEEFLGPSRPPPTA